VCIFFDIDISVTGLNSGRYLPEIRAVETTVNLRMHLYSLLYRDQCLSMPEGAMHHPAGFLNQCHVSLPNINLKRMCVF
jgi:hypothetical protein